MSKCVKQVLKWHTRDGDLLNLVEGLKMVKALATSDYDARGELKPTIATATERNDESLGKQSIFHLIHCRRCLTFNNGLEKSETINWEHSNNKVV